MRLWILQKSGELISNMAIVFPRKLQSKITHLKVANLITITQLIVINIAPLTVLFCNCELICNCPLLKNISFNFKFFVGLKWLTSNHMFGLGNFWDKSPSWFLKILKLPSFYSGNFKFSKMHPGNLSQISLPNMLSFNTKCFLVWCD